MEGNDMSVKKVLLVAVLCVVLCVCVGLVVQPAHAQADGKAGAGDKSLSAKKGLEVLGGSKGKDKPKASLVQMVVGVGSIFVTVAIVKWL